MIPAELLETYKAQVKNYTKGECVFNELETPKHFYQIKHGQIKMYNLTEDGKEFAQGFFDSGFSFGEPPLIGNFKYPASAKCLTDCSVYVIDKTSFFKLLEEHPKLLFKFTQGLCKRMHYKAKTMKEVSVYPPEHRIISLISYLKESSNTMGLYEVKLTRQQIGELTGLRVETVIRSIKSLEKTKVLSIVNRKVFL
jgi:CRP-like cAMP-binding protein